MVYPIAHWCNYWCTSIKCWSEQITIKERKSNNRSWKGKKLPRIYGPKAANFDKWRLIFLKKIIWFLFPGSCCISSCRFSKYFWDDLRGFQQIYFKISWMRLGFSFFFFHFARLFLCKFSHFVGKTTLQKNSENLPFELKFKVTRHFWAWVL